MDDIGNFDLITDFEDLSGLTQADPIPMPTENIVRKRKFDDPVSDTQMLENFTNAIPLKTRRQNNWSLSLWQEWATHRNGLDISKSSTFYPVPVRKFSLSIFKK